MNEAVRLPAAASAQVIRLWPPAGSPGSVIDAALPVAPGRQERLAPEELLASEVRDRRATQPWLTRPRVLAGGAAVLLLAGALASLWRPSPVVPPAARPAEPESYGVLLPLPAQGLTARKAPAPALPQHITPQAWQALLAARSASAPMAGESAAMHTVAPAPAPLAGRLVLSADAPLRRTAPHTDRARTRLPMRPQSDQVALPATPPTPPRSLLAAAAWSVFVPMASAGETDASPVAAESVAQRADAGLPGSAPANESEDDRTAPVEVFQYSDDPRMRKCQVGSFQDHVDLACAQARSDTDGGVAYDACVREIEIKVRQCYAR